MLAPCGADVVSYFVVAQDGAATPNVSVSPSAGAAGLTANPPAAAYAADDAQSSYTIVASIAGTFSVGAGGDYATLTAAVADLNAKYMSGPVVFVLTDATYVRGDVPDHGERERRRERDQHADHPPGQPARPR